MKKALLLFAGLILVLALGLRTYFEMVPPPVPTLEGDLAEIIPSELKGWKITDQDMDESEEASARISEFLNFDDALFRLFRKGDTFVGLYVAYWTPGKVSYRWAGAHTPNTCWVVNGWERIHREYAIPFSGGNGETFDLAEYGVYSRDGLAQNVYFWHLVGGEPFSYDQKGTPNIFAALLDIQNYGLKLREEQFFIRLSSNRTIEELRALPEFSEILDSLGSIGLECEASKLAAESKSLPADGIDA